MWTMRNRNRAALERESMNYKEALEKRRLNGYLSHESETEDYIFALEEQTIKLAEALEQVHPDDFLYDDGSEDRRDAVVNALGEFNAWLKEGQ